MSHVAQRVKHGGDFVDNDSIQYDFEEELKNLQFFTNPLDHVEILDAAFKFLDLKPLLTVQD